MTLPCYVKLYITRESQWEADVRNVLHHQTYDYQHSRCRSLEALRLQQLDKPPQCFSGSWLSHQWMNITSPQSDLGVSVSNETHFSSQRDKALKCECHLQSKGGTRNRAICRYSFVRYERYSLTATITFRCHLLVFCENILKIPRPSNKVLVCEAIYANSVSSIYKRNPQPKSTKEKVPQIFRFAGL